MALRTPLSAGGAEDGPVRFEELWADREILHSYCRRISGDAALADDMVQEAYAEAFVNLDELERRSSFLPWLTTVARRRGLNELRRYRYSTPVGTLPEDGGGVEPDPADAAVTRERVRQLRDALTMLTPRERDLLVRQVNQGMSIGELAREEHSTPASVRSVLMRARAKLRAHLDDGFAWAFLPVARLSDWARRRLGAVSARASETSQLASAASQLTEVVAAAVVATSLVGAPALAAEPSSDGLAPPFTHTGSLTYAAHVVDGGGVVDDGAGWPQTPSQTGGEVARSTVGSGQVLFGGASVSTSGGDGGSPGDDSGPDPIAAPLGAPGGTVPPVDEDDPVYAPEDIDVSHLSIVAPAGAQPADSQLVFALGRNQESCTSACTALFRSDDRGTTWRKLAAAGLGDAGSLLVAPDYPSDPRIYAMGPDGLRLSVDGGASFVGVEGEPHEGPAAMSPLFSEGDERILVGSAPPWVYDAGRDGLAPFTDAPMTGPVNYFAFAPDYGASRLLFAGTMLSGPPGARRVVVYRCVEHECGQGIDLVGLSAAPRIKVSSRFAEDGVVLAWADDKLRVSSDRGRSFGPVSAPPTGMITDVADDGKGAFYAAAFEDLSDPGGVLVSTDGGRTWVLRGQGTPLEAGVQAVGALPGGRLLAAPTSLAGSGVWCSDDHGATWSQRCS